MFVTTSPPQPAGREPVQGKRLLSALRAKGIDANNVVRNRRTGVYSVKFAAPNVNNFYSRGTDPARVWAQRIEACFDDVDIVDTYESVADWHPQRPVLYATVFLRVIAKQKSA